MEPTTSYDSFFSTLNATLATSQQYQRINDRALALQFNPLLDFLKIGETQFSKILATFLRPEGSHGQGRAFLDAFLHRIGKGNLSFSSVNVYTEFTTAVGRRIDLVLDFDKGRFGIGIENKIWALDQHNQLSDYVKCLDQNFGSNFFMLYWTPYKRVAGDWTLSEASRIQLEEEEKFRCLDYS